MEEVLESWQKWKVHFAWGRDVKLCGQRQNVAGCTFQRSKDGCITFHMLFLHCDWKFSHWKVGSDFPLLESGSGEGLRSTEYAICDSMWLLRLGHKGDTDSCSFTLTPPLEPSHSVKWKSWTYLLTIPAKVSAKSQYHHQMCEWACLQMIPAPNLSPKFMLSGADTHSQGWVLPELHTHEQNKFC